MGLFASAARARHLGSAGLELGRRTFTLPETAHAPSGLPGGNALTRVQASPRTVRAGRRWSRSGRRAGKSVSARSDPGNIYGLLEAGQREAGALAARQAGSAVHLGPLRSPAGGRRVRKGDPEPPTSGHVRSLLGRRPQPGTKEPPAVSFHLRAGRMIAAGILGRQAGVESARGTSAFGSSRDSPTSQAGK